MCRSTYQLAIGLSDTGKPWATGHENETALLRVFVIKEALDTIYQLTDLSASIRQQTMVLQELLYRPVGNY